MAGALTWKFARRQAAAVGFAAGPTLRSNAVVMTREKKQLSSSYTITAKILRYPNGDYIKESQNQIKVRSGADEFVLTTVQMSNGDAITIGGPNFFTVIERPASDAIWKTTANRGP